MQDPKVMMNSTVAVDMKGQPENVHVLEVEGLTLRRADGANILENLSFTISAGEILGMVGESSAGKSMVGNAVAGLLPAGIERTAGTIRLCGRSVEGLDESKRRPLLGTKIGVILQDPLASLNPLMTVGEHFRETFAAHGLASSKENVRVKSLALLHEVGLSAPEKRLTQYPHELSGGMRQRVVIALALAADPALIIADEPTTALDVSIQAQIITLLRRLAETRGCAVMLITHDMGVVAETADRLAVLYAGRIVEEGRTESVLRSPQHPYTKGLMGAIPDPTSPALWLEQIEGSMPDPVNRPSGCPFHPRCRAVNDVCRHKRPPMEDFGTSRAACWLAAANGRSVPDSVVRFHPPVKRNWKEREGERVAGLADAPVLFEARDVEKHFVLRSAGLVGKLFGRRDETVAALSGVSLSIRRGETLALVGESGCGKSTFAKIVTGLTKADHGTVGFADGRNGVPGRLNMIFQDPYASLDPRMTVAAIWEEPLKSLRPEMTVTERRARLKELARLVGLAPEALTKYPHEFSGGQRQRISIARAVAAEPELLVCDEPTSALDVSVQAQVLNLMKTLQLEKGLSYLFISHNLGVVHHIADRVAVMYFGRLVEVASKDAIFHTPLHPYTQMLLDAVPRVNASKRRTVETKNASEGDDDVRFHFGCPFASRCPKASDRCRSEAPSLRRVKGPESMRFVACHRVSE